MNKKNCLHHWAAGKKILTLTNSSNPPLKDQMVHPLFWQIRDHNYFKPLYDYHVKMINNLRGYATNFSGFKLICTKIPRFATNSYIYSATINTDKTTMSKQSYRELKSLAKT